MRVSLATAQSTAEAAFAFAAKQAQFGYAEIAIEMRMSEDWARKVVRAWNKDGHLETLRAGHQIRTLYRVKPGSQPKMIYSRSPEQCMWTAMRQLKSFGPRVLAAHAGTEQTEVTPEAATDYCRALLGAGYLVVARKAVPGKIEAIYRLTRDTGPRPPREKRVRAVIDDNNETVTVIGGGQ